jgi:sugar phosphate isomerase/epimerase
MLAATSRTALIGAAESLPYLQDRGWLVGFWTRPWANHDYRVGFDAIVSSGARHVALTGAKSRTGRVIGVGTTQDEAQQVGQEARARGLTITTVYGGNVPLDKGTDALRQMIDSCEAAGGWSVMLSNVGNEATYEASCKTVAECAEYAAGKKIAMVLKPHGGTTGTGPQLRDTVKRIGHPNLSVMYDPGNIFFYSEGKVNPIEDCRAVLGLVRSLSIKDFRAPREVMFTPGTGQVDFPKLLAELHRGGFTHGPLLIESLTPGDLNQTLAEAKKAKQFVEQLVSRLAA